jgi:hypothetical protein
VVEEVVPVPSLTMQVESADWRMPLLEFISKGVIPEDEKEAKQLLKKVTRCTVVEGHLFRRGISIPSLRSIGPFEVWYILTEIHEGIYGHHVRAKSLVRKALRVGYI